MKRQNIYQDRSQELLALFEGAGNHGKLICVSIDYAKKQRENLQASTELDNHGTLSLGYQKSHDGLEVFLAPGCEGVEREEGSQ